MRDYKNAHIMDWKEIGPTTLDEYDEDVLAELDKRLQERNARIEADRIEREKKRTQQLADLELKIGDSKMAITDQEAWDKGYEVNSKDGYGKMIFEYADRWARLMQHYVHEGEQISECAEKASHEADTDGITGFMYGAAVHILAQTWVHGEQLRQWHNAQYDHKGSGTVNPAIMTIG